MSKIKDNSEIRHQILLFSFTSQYQEISKEIEVDERFNFIESIFFVDDAYFGRATIQKFRIENNDSLFEQDISIAFYQTFIENKGLELNQKLNTKKAKINVVLKDNSASFTAHTVQVVLKLRQAE